MPEQDRRIPGWQAFRTPIRRHGVDALVDTVDDLVNFRPPPEKHVIRHPTVAEHKRGDFRTTHSFLTSPAPGFAEDACGCIRGRDGGSRRRTPHLHHIQSTSDMVQNCTRLPGLRL